MGTLLGLGTSVVTFGYFFADLGTVISGGSSALGAGDSGLIGWLLCTTGAALAAWPPGLAGGPHWQLARSGRLAVTLAVTTLLAVGVAVAFAPSWDSYTLRTPAQVIQTVTAGNIFANPGPVIFGNVAVMVALVAVAVAAALWQPTRLGAALLAGALIPMAAQAISALIQLSQGISPAQFGISASRAAQLGLTITSGLTAAFWIYFALVIALAGVCAWMLIQPRREQGSAGWSGYGTRLGVPPGRLRIVWAEALSRRAAGMERLRKRPPMDTTSAGEAASRPAGRLRAWPGGWDEAMAGALAKVAAGSRPSVSA